MNPLKIGSMMFAASLATSAVSAQTLPDEIQASKVVRGALDLPYVPLEFRDPDTNELIGFDVELGKAMADVLGVTIEYHEGGFETMTPALQSGRVDIIMSGFYDRPARREHFDFIDYLKAGGQLFALKSRDDLNAPVDLCGKVVTTIRATSYPEAVQEFSDANCVAAGLEPITVTPDNDVPQMMINLRTGRADAAIQGLESVPSIMAGEPDTYRPLGEPLGSALMGIAFNKESTLLRDAFVHALRKVIADGRYDELIKKYQLELSSYTDVTVNGEPAP